MAVSVRGRYPGRGPRTAMNEASDTWKRQKKATKNKIKSRKLEGVGVAWPSGSGIVALFASPGGRNKSYR